MLAYPIDEAEDMLRTKLDAASSTLKTCDEDMNYLKEQLTVSYISPVV